MKLVPVTEIQGKQTQTLESGYIDKIKEFLASGAKQVVVESDAEPRTVYAGLMVARTRYGMTRSDVVIRLLRGDDGVQRVYMLKGRSRRYV